MWLTKANEFVCIINGYFTNVKLYCSDSMYIIEKAILRSDTVYYFTITAGVAKLVDARALGARGAILGGSSPLPGTSERSELCGSKAPARFAREDSKRLSIFSSFAKQSGKMRDLYRSCKDRVLFRRTN